MPITASALRQDVYRLLDAVLETGVPLEIERRGRLLRIVATEPVRKLDRLVPHPGFTSARDDRLEDAGWTTAWEGEPELDLPVEDIKAS